MKKAFLIGSASLFALAGYPAFAQDVPDDSGDIVVTASRTESLASKTPVALTAVTGEGLRNAGITNPTTLAEQVPSVSIDRNNNGLQITIRGVTSTDLTEKGDPSAAFLLDGIYIARAQAQEVSFFDITRVEVLRGPQGTLYGRNTTAGLINVITNRPKYDFEGSFDGGFGNYGTWQASGMINLPASEALAFRAALNYDRRDSFLRAGPNFTADLSPFKENISARLQALLSWDSGDLLIRGDYSDIGGKTTNTIPITNFYTGINTTGVDPRYVGGNAKALRTVNAPVTWDLDRNNKSWGVSAELNWDFGPVALAYLGSYREFERHETNATILFNGGAAFRSRFDGAYWQNSQELRLATTGNGPLKAQAGLYYFKEKSSIGFYLFDLVGPVFGFPQDPTIAESWAAFAQGTYSLTPEFRVTAGVRYSHDDKSRVGGTVFCQTVACDDPTDLRLVNDASRKFSKTTWRLGVDYDLDTRSLLYGIVSTGYKAGGFNDGCSETDPDCNQPRTDDVLYYEPETLTAYEIGLKTRFAQNAVRLNASVFHYDYKNIQLSQTADCNGGPCLVTSNAGKASVSGVELEGVVAPDDRNKLDFSVAWLDAHYTDFEPLAGIDWKDKKLDRSPSWTISAGYTYTVPLANDGRVSAGVRTRVSDSYVIAALGNATQHRQPGYTKTDLTLTYTAPESRWYIQGFVRNLEDEIVVSSVTSGNFASVQIADPRTYGMRAGFKF